MIKHYLTVAFRNLWKYKTQSLISIIGLAVGFTCFSLASLWVRYEMTYDSFHKNAKQIYVLTGPDRDTKVTTMLPNILTDYLKETYPEIKRAAHFQPGSSESIENHQFTFAYVDSAFLSMFDVKIISGNPHFLNPESTDIAITEETAKKIFGSENPIGQTIGTKGSGRVVSAVVSGWSKHSNLKYDILSSVTKDTRWNYAYRDYSIIELYPGTDVASFSKKLSESEIVRDAGEGGTVTIRNIGFLPLTDFYYKNPLRPQELKFEHLLLFIFASLLVIAASLFNYMTLFVSRFRIREKEMALRMVCGASGKSLFALLSVEFLITLFISFFTGILLTMVLLPVYLKSAGITMNISSVYLELSAYILAVIFCASLVFGMVLLFFRKRTLSTSIRKTNRHLFRKLSILFQLIVSLGFIFCTGIMLRQIYFLQNVDLGFSVKNTAYISAWNFPDISLLENKLREIPEIEEVTAEIFPLLPVFGYTTFSISEWDDKMSDELTAISVHRVSPQYLKLYDFQVKDGKLFAENDPPDRILINETAVKAFGWDEAVGKKVDGKIVKGVVKNVYSALPTVPVQPEMYLPLNREKDQVRYLLFKYKGESFTDIESKMRQIIDKEFPEIGTYQIGDSEKVFNDYLQSERTLIQFLSIITFICIAISVFGFFSLVSLTCEERRKEIAIRKVNGAGIKDILGAFFREYFLLLFLGALIAFPIGYYLVSLWMEQYVRKISIDAWVYILIFSAMGLIIILCVSWKVMKVARINPAETLKMN